MIVSFFIERLSDGFDHKCIIPAPIPDVKAELRAKLTAYNEAFLLPRKKMLEIYENNSIV